MLVWGFFISTVACYHGTYTINSLCHVLGRAPLPDRRRQPQQPAARADHARRGLAQQPPPLPERARQGFYWWEIDITYYVLRLLAALGVIWDLKPVPARDPRVRTRAVTP